MKVTTYRIKKNQEKFTVQFMYLFIKPFIDNIRVIFQEIVNYFINPNVSESQFCWSGSIYNTHTLEEAVDSTR